MASRRLPAWDRRPRDLADAGYAQDAAHVFGRLQRIDTWDEAGPVLGRAAAEFVRRELDLALPPIVDERTSADGSTRAVIELEGGERIEAVHMPRSTKSARANRVTVCLSSQVGCAMGCTFCATAEMGLRRQLRADEIVAQLLAVLRRYGPKERSPGARLNLVFMGMGEPLQNLDALERALDVLADPAGLGIAPSRITVSTVGHVPGIDRLARLRNRPRLAVSINAASEPLRRSLMPVTKAWPLSALRDAIVRWPSDPHEKLTLEYVLLAGTNDDLASAERLAAWAGEIADAREGVGPRRVILNLIPWNRWDGAPFAEPTGEVVAAFADRVRAVAPRLLVNQRANRGRDVKAACGTLATPSMA